LGEHRGAIAKSHHGSRSIVVGSDISKGGVRGRLNAALPAERFGDHLRILSGTGQNIVGLAVYVVASLGTNILISRRLGAAALGVVTLATQFAFVAGAATRFGMDMATVRMVAIDIGRGEPGRVRGVMARASAIAAVVSGVVAVAVFLAAPGLARAFGSRVLGKPAFQAAALALPFVALCQVYLGGTRGLKIMRHTLFIYWAGQPVAWIALLVGGWAVAQTVGVTTLAYAGSWILATIAAWFAWRRETAQYPATPPPPGELRDLLGYGTPRAPAALLGQLLFWTDYFVASRYVTSQTLGVYAAAVRVSQALVLFLIAVNYMFSPFVADLHERGERVQLDALYKALTRWIVAGSLPILLTLLVLPGPVLLVFGGSFATGTTALRILLVGQTVNVATGSVGFILIMVGRTGWDLMVYLGSFLLDFALAVLLSSHLGTTGAAIAQAVTLAASNGVRLYLVWRFVRHYARLAIPAAAGGGAMVAVHLALRHGAWPVDLLVSALSGAAVYAAVLVWVGLAPAERAALSRVLGRPRKETSSARPE
jgi:O-antigen/teichoic acid export membrane protein